MKGLFRLIFLSLIICKVVVADEAQGNMFFHLGPEPSGAMAEETPTGE